MASIHVRPLVPIKIETDAHQYLEIVKRCGSFTARATDRYSFVDRRISIVQGMDGEHSLSHIQMSRGEAEQLRFLLADIIAAYDEHWPMQPRGPIVEDEH